MKNLIKFSLFAFLLLSNVMMFAQGGPGGDGDDGLEGDDPLPTPINSKLIILLIFGIVYAIYTFRTKKNKAY